MGYVEGDTAGVGVFASYMPKRGSLTVSKHISGLYNVDLILKVYIIFWKVSVHLSVNIHNNVDNEIVII